MGSHFLDDFGADDGVGGDPCLADDCLLFGGDPGRLTAAFIGKEPNRSCLSV